MQINPIKTLLLLLVFEKCNCADPQLPWRTFGCDNWDYKASSGKSINDIWANTNLMATNAVAQLDKIPTRGGVMSSSEKIATTNFEAMFGNLHWGFLTGLGPDAKTSITTVKHYSETLTDIQSAQEKTLKGDGVDLTNENTQVFLFCGGDVFQHGKPTGTPFPSYDVYYLDVESTAKATAGKRQILIPTSFAYANAPRPCTEVYNSKLPAEDPRQPYLGKTFNTIEIIQDGDDATKTEEQFIGIILCPLKHPLYTPVATLDVGFVPQVPVADFSDSAAGILLHELAHVVGRSRKKNGIWLDQAGGFDKCVNLGKQTITPKLNPFLNPDSYRMFAQMSMSPATKWRAKTKNDKPPNTGGPPDPNQPPPRGPKKPDAPPSRRVRRFLE